VIEGRRFEGSMIYEDDSKKCDSNVLWEYDIDYVCEGE
jgi:hypothetical protein